MLKFKGEVWAADIQDGLDALTVFKENCNSKYEGDAKKPGDAVRIFTWGDVTSDVWTDGQLHELPDPTAIEGSSMLMPINQVRYLNPFFVDDLDKEQAKGGSGAIAHYSDRAKVNWANCIDQFIAGLHVGQAKHTTTTAQISADGASTTTAILDAIDGAYELLLEENVTRGTEVTLTAPPWFIMMLKRAYIELDTDNSEMLKNGRVGRYGGITLKESNNVYHATEGGHDVYHIQLKTNEAIAFVNPYTHIEGYRPDGYFMDCIKGYTLYDGKCVRPEQVVDLAVYK